MKRRTILKYLGIGTASIPILYHCSSHCDKVKNKVLRIAHITDVHIHSEHDAPNRFSKCIQEIKKHNVDFFLNGGDSIWAADYSYIKREYVNEQWDIWRKVRKEFSEYKMFSCLGNHDMWWVPEKDDEMYGKDYVVKQLDIPNNYYSFSKKGWHFIILDSNNDGGGSLGDEQMKWLEGELDKLPAKAPVVIMTHYPILAAVSVVDGIGNNHRDHKKLIQLFYKYKDKKINCISGHVHLLDQVRYNNVNYYCNGALSGFWWGIGNKDSTQKYWYRQTPPGYAILDLYQDGTMTNTYYSHDF